MTLFLRASSVDEWHNGNRGHGRAPQLFPRQQSFATPDVFTKVHRLNVRLSVEFFVQKDAQLIEILKCIRPSPKRNLGPHRKSVRWFVEYVQSDEFGRDFKCALAVPFGKSGFSSIQSLSVRGLGQPYASLCKPIAECR